MQFFLNKDVIFQNVDLVLTLTKSTLKSRYRKTVAGFLWVILNPVLTFAVQAIIFKHILKVNVENFYLFLLSGVIPWIFITSTLNMTASSFVQNRAVMMAFKLDPWIFILAQSLDNLITLVASFTILLLMTGDLSVFMGLRIPLFVLTLFLLAFATFFLSFLIATIHVFMRDTQFIVQFLLNLIYFITPIFYPKDLIPAKYQWLINYNPLFILIKPFQSIFWRYDISLFVKDSLNSLVLIFLITTFCILFWRRKKNDIYFNI